MVSVYTAGLAYIGSICRTKEGKSASIVFDKGDFLGVGIAVHELAHRFVL